ncbi:hypothetical protein BpHYR1_053756 [Brachionus plicatilis]|uniref:Uncharacterized protein n=1 Tax=Brachionus plicatilis TaxID=10195 RepID=A0A3M7QDX7_BRAPC|nr:hypothetical protein BpHYR1_053756 [Brachionus plicatilis]
MNLLFVITLTKIKELVFGQNRTKILLRIGNIIEMENTGLAKIDQIKKSEIVKPKFKLKSLKALAIA